MLQRGYNYGGRGIYLGESSLLNQFNSIPFLFNYLQLFLLRTENLSLESTCPISSSPPPNRQPS